MDTKTFIPVVLAYVWHYFCEQKSSLPWMQSKESAVELDTSQQLKRYSRLPLLIWKAEKIQSNEIIY